MLNCILKPVVFAFLLVSIITGCSVSEKVDVQTLFGYAMGTSYSIKVVSTLAESRSLQLGVEGVLSDVNARMSTYLPRSDISVFSAAPVNVDIEVSEKTAKVVQRSLLIAGETDGFFDPTVAPLVDLWGFGPTARNNVVPSGVQIENILQNTGYGEVFADVKASTLTKTEDRKIDLSAIAKGYAVDLVALYLDEKGYSNYLVEVGGEMRFSGQKPEGSSWRIAIERPDASERSAFRIIEINHGAVATSGDYRNFFEIEGKRYSHTINPKTGYPVEHDLASVTVVMDDCIDADAYATAFMAMGKESAMKLAEDQGIAAFLIYNDKESFVSLQSSRFTELFGKEMPL